MTYIIYKKQTILLDDNVYSLLKATFGEPLPLELRAPKAKQRPYVLVRLPIATGKPKTISVARFLMHLTGESDQRIIFRDQNPLNLQCSNLLIGTPADVQKGRTAPRNASSRYIGVSYIPGAKKWRAIIKPSKEEKSKYLGLFKEEKQAAAAYNEAALTYHGVYANLNAL